MMAKTKLYKPKQISSTPKGFLLYIFLVPLFISVILSLIQTNIWAFVWNGIAFLMFFITLKLSQKGFEQEKEYLLSTLTKAPEIPYKSISALMLGLSTFFTAWIAGNEPFVISIFLGVISFVGYFLYYGFDPKGDKLDNIGDISAEFVLETIAEAKGKLSKISEDREKIKDKKLIDALDISIKKAQLILDTIQQDPKDIRVARKFLIVYIDGIAKVTNSYVSMDESDIDDTTKEKLLGLMYDLDIKFDKELDRLKQNNLFDLDVNIDVLKEQIKN